MAGNIVDVSCIISYTLSSKRSQTCLVPFGSPLIFERTICGFEPHLAAQHEFFLTTEQAAGKSKQVLAAKLCGEDCFSFPVW